MFKNKKLSDWKDVDNTLRELGQLKIQICGVENKYAPKMNEIKAAQTAELEPLQKQTEALEGKVQTFCEEHKAEFAEKRSKKLTFGTISARLVKKFDFPTTKDKLKDLLENLKKIGRADCIEQKETPSKAKIEEMDADTLAKLGLKLEKADSFTIKTTT